MVSIVLHKHAWQIHLLPSVMASTMITASSCSRIFCSIHKAVHSPRGFLLSTFFISTNSMMCIVYGFTVFLLVRFWSFSLYGDVRTVHFADHSRCPEAVFGWSTLSLRTRCGLTCCFAVSTCDCF